MDDPKKWRNTSEQRLQIGGLRRDPLLYRLDENKVMFSYLFVFVITSFMDNPQKGDVIQVANWGLRRDRANLCFIAGP